MGDREPPVHPQGIRVPWWSERDVVLPSEDGSFEVSRFDHMRGGVIEVVCGGCGYRTEMMCDNCVGRLMWDHAHGDHAARANHDEVE
jgi:hypothetical protein